ncbi:MAG: thioredoxin [Candidatus Omnitrophica bacterium]|nr:thioredoxin [Candidatus Omnitrophota bacterium]
MEINLNRNNFAKEVFESKIPVLVDFWASWCGPCKMVAPHIEELAKEKKDKIKVCKLNVDDEPEIASQFMVMSIPTLMVFKDGKVVDRKVGSLSKYELEKFISAYI